ncbi:hypothetical protein EJ06DRAFT_554043 [Trichodelitschia bisporula]|uniref:Infection structure specific protein n=1 Tax=Trichodelitschia bisporula TaxID=703511 RepID=A0A6G1I6W6_9PEZI|nr:hypothetical protein EJ06DRAFT_554043 [Trichodelitschia bisporula]
MLSNILVLALAATAAIAEPIQKRQDFTMSDLDTASLLSAASALQAITSDMPTLPSSALSVLATAIPQSVLTNADYGCELLTSTPGWFKSLPADVKSALTSYELAAVSWADKHSSELNQFTSGLSLPSVCTAATNGAKTGKASAAQTGTGAGTGTQSGAKATGTVGAAQQSGNGAAARPTGLIAAGMAGAAGVLGLAVML